MSPDQIESLYELKKLLEAGIIDNTEFEQQKKLVLNPHQNTSDTHKRDVTTSNSSAVVDDSETSESNINQIPLWLIGIILTVIIVIIPLLVYMSKNR